jgi:hypothetical protein
LAHESPNTRGRTLEQSESGRYDDEKGSDSIENIRIGGVSLLSWRFWVIDVDGLSFVFKLGRIRWRNRAAVGVDDAARRVESDFNAGSAV